MKSVTVVALSAVSGVPLFIRHRGSTRSPSYNVVGSLNGVFMFGESQGTRLMETHMPYTAITWKTYYDSVRLILIHGEDPDSAKKANGFTTGYSGSTSCFSQPCFLLGGVADHRLLDLVFNSLVLLLSIDALTNTSNVERLKKDMKVCYPLLDVLLERCEVTSGGAMKACGVGGVGGPGPLFSHLVHCADTVLPPDNYNLQCEVQKWSEGYCSTSYGCLLSCSGRVLAATRTFWTLSSTELVLLPLLLLAAPAPNTAKDMPVYLPHKSPKVPFRLLGLQLTSHVWSVSLCGPLPSLASVLRSAALFWAPYYAGIETLAATQPYNMTAGLRQALDRAVLGLLLVNYESKRCISCVHLGPSNKQHSASATTVTSTIAATTTATSPGKTGTGKAAPPSPVLPPSNTGTVKSVASNKSGHSDTRSRKSSKSALSHHHGTGPPSQTSTLKSSSGKTVIHTHQTVQADISPVQSQRALSPHSSNRAQSPSSRRMLSPHSRPSKCVSRTISPPPPLSNNSNQNNNNAKINSSSTQAVSPSVLYNKTTSSSRPRSPDTGKSARALSPSNLAYPNTTSTLRRVKSNSCPGVASAASSYSSLPLSPSVKTAALASVYRALLGGVLTAYGDTPGAGESSTFGAEVLEAYVWCGSCRVYAVQTPAPSSLHLLVLLPPALPHTLARSVTYKTLDVFLKGKTLRL